MCKPQTAETEQETILRPLTAAAASLITVIVVVVVIILTGQSLRLCLGQRLGLMPDSEKEIRGREWASAAGLTSCSEYEMLDYDCVIV